MARSTIGVFSELGRLKGYAIWTIAQEPDLALVARSTIGVFSELGRLKGYAIWTIAHHLASETHPNHLL